jgi:uncharacterized protein YndB with AHSA1/START domain
MTFSTSVEIAAPPSLVWTILSDVELWPQWTPTVTGIRSLDPGPISIGSRLRILQPKLPPADWRMTAIVPGQSFTWITRGIGVQVTAHHTVGPTPCGSRVTLSIQFSGPFGRFVAWLTRDLNNRYLALESAGLKQFSEQRAQAATAASSHL